MTPDLRAAIETRIRDAFRGVKLGSGISLRQAQASDGYARLDQSQLGSEEKDDWSRIPLAELERDCIAHLDAQGFRYYISAFMLSVLTHYDPRSMRVIGTLSGLYPKRDSWD